MRQTRLRSWTSSDEPFRLYLVGRVDARTSNLCKKFRFERNIVVCSSSRNDFRDSFAFLQRTRQLCHNQMATLITVIYSSPNVTQAKHWWRTRHHRSLTNVLFKSEGVKVARSSFSEQDPIAKLLTKSRKLGGKLVEFMVSARRNLNRRRNSLFIAFVRSTGKKQLRCCRASTFR